MRTLKLFEPGDGIICSDLIRTFEIWGRGVSKLIRYSWLQFLNLILFQSKRAYQRWLVLIFASQAKAQTLLGVRPVVDRVADS